MPPCTRANTGQLQRPSIRPRSTVCAAGLGVVGCQRKVPHAARDRTGANDVPARRAGQTFRQGRRAAFGPLEGLSVLDIGCGGGLVCEPLARLGASVTGIDPASSNIEAARRHAEGQEPASTTGWPASRTWWPRVPLRRGGVPGSGRARARPRCVLQVVRRTGAAGRADAAFPPSTARSRPICWPSSAPSTCCAGCRSARTSGSGS